MKHYKDPNTNEIYAYEADGSQDAYIKPHLVLITNEEADQIRTGTRETIFNNLSYGEKRMTEYPSIGNQLDMLWHAMESGVLPKVDDFYNAIKSIKDKYPKE